MAFDSRVILTYAFKHADDVFSALPFDVSRSLSERARRCRHSLASSNALIARRKTA